MPSLKPLINFHKKKYTRGLGITVSAQRGHFILGKFFTGFTESRQQTDTLLTAVSSWLFIWGDDVVWEKTRKSLASLEFVFFFSTIAIYGEPHLHLCVTAVSFRTVEVKESPLTFGRPGNVVSLFEVD